MNKKTLIILFIVLAAIVVAIFGIRFFSGEDSWICSDGVWIRHGNPSSLMPDEACGIGENKTASTPETINFMKIGNMTRDDFGVWKLIYEKPGAPALSVKLVFSEKSVCKNGEETVLCESFLNIGDRVKVEGLADSKMEKVEVRLMEKIK